MEAVLLVIHLLACLALIGAVLLQRSEGGALGMSGGGTGGFISGRGVANVLVRTTMVLGAGFFVTSLVLARLHSSEASRGTELERTIEERSNDAFDPLSGGAAAPSTSTPSNIPSTDPLAAPGATPGTGAATPGVPASPPLADPLAPAQAQSQSPPAAAGLTPPASTPSAPASSPPAPTSAPAPAPAPQ